ncbi:MAG TPA: ANTAR domain-containing protein [Mycobacteriales bacterium]|jgi:hypothetical protein|nr:ANTAR domain-containing protein [Mycobacteriales bacterium]
MGTPAEHPFTVYRTATGWRVGMPGQSTVEGGPASSDDLFSALVLADLLGADVAPATVAPVGRPGRATAELDETGRLRVAVHQLEHALAARVVVEQAIGVLAERAGVVPRTAFEELRKVARSQGRKVHDLAREVVASVTDGSVLLPGGLPNRR